MKNVGVITTIISAIELLKIRMKGIRHMKNEMNFNKKRSTVFFIFYLFSIKFLVTKGLI